MNNCDWRHNYTFIRKIGSGGYADVYLYMKDSKLLAVKIFRIESDYDREYAEEEVEKHLKVQNCPGSENYIAPILRIYKCEDPFELAIIMPYYHQTLQEYLYTLEPHDFETISSIMKQILRGINWLHRCGLSHGDLYASSNIMWDEGIKMIDFGESETEDPIRDYEVFTDLVRDSIRDNHMCLARTLSQTEEVRRYWSKQRSGINYDQIFTENFILEQRLIAIRHHVNKLVEENKSNDIIKIILASKKILKDELNYDEIDELGETAKMVAEVLYEEGDSETLNRIYDMILKHG